MLPQSIIALFPGQGSQQVGMGQNFLNDSEFARDLFAQADKILGFSLSKIALEGPLDLLTLTANAQPAILLVSYIAFKTWNNANAVACATGHSLGEYSALVAAESLSFADAILLVHKRGRYMQEAVPSGVGKMVAVLGKELTEIEAILNELDHMEVDIANINAPGQIVLSGSIAGVDRALEGLGKGKYIELPVSAPFHSRLMQPAAERLAADIAAITIAPPKFPVIANVSAAAVTDPKEIAQLLVSQVSGRVRWVECLTNARAIAPEAVGVEFGTGNVLAGLGKRIDKSFSIVAMDGPMGAAVGV